MQSPTTIWSSGSTGFASTFEAAEAGFRFRVLLNLRVDRFDRHGTVSRNARNGLKRGESLTG
jgi:hypothetical protein